ncbi:MAG TPA: GAF domain-containing sensor histidine kinase [Nocardioidaceae bacterium]|nr:GAF domain-containing sensor histidine kinase [Nocardioidaceae bacterium]
MTDDQPREVTTLRRLHELMCRVNAGEDLASVLQSLVDGVADVTGFAVAAVSYLHPDRFLEVVAVAGDDAARDQLIGTRTPVEEISDEFAIADDWGLLKFVPHERLNGETGRGWIPDVKPLDVPDAWHPEDALLAPLSAPTGEMVGLLSVDLPRDGRRPGRFAREALEMYAAQAGIAISNAKQRERLREEVRLAAAARDVAQAAGNALDLRRVIDAGVAPILRGLSCDALWIRAFEGRGEVTGRARGAIQSEPRLVPPEELVALARRVAERSWTERRAAILPPSHLAPATDLSDDETKMVLDFIGQTGCNSLLLAPLGAGPECLGYLALGRAADASSWTDEEITAALEIGRDLGRAVLHARLFERERQLVQELQQLDRYKTEMISTIAHELKNPLTAIIGHLEMLETTEDGRVTGRSLAAIERGATKLSDLVSDLLLLSKVGDPHRPLLPTPVDLSDIVTCAAEMLHAQAAKHDVTIDLVGTDDKVTAHGNAAELDRVICNLLSNAVKFSPPGGTVTCSLEEAGDSVVVRCRDEGIGISPEDQEQLFTEFFRSTNPDALEIPGTGLGLTIVKRIVERHRGTISLDSDLGKGATFTVTLPGAAAMA